MDINDYVNNATDRQAETEVNAESNIDQVRTIFADLLSNPELRSEDIFDWFVRDGVNKTAGDVETVASIALWKTVAAYMDLPFDRLNEIPVFDRSTAWEVAASAMIAAASRQAKIMSGLTQQAMIDGVDNADDLIEATKDLSDEQLKEIQVDIKGEMKRKKDAKRNG
jgi:hypothetical protein